MWIQRLIPIKTNRMSLYVQNFVDNYVQHSFFKCKLDAHSSETYRSASLSQEYGSARIVPRLWLRFTTNLMSSVCELGVLSIGGKIMFSQHNGLRTAWYHELEPLFQVPPSPRCLPNNLHPFPPIFFLPSSNWLTCKMQSKTEQVMTDK